MSAAETGPYLRLENGVHSVWGARLDNSVALTGAASLNGTASASTRFRTSYYGGGAFGYNFEHFSLELALDYSENQLRSVEDTPVDGLKLSQTTLLANVGYKLKLDEFVTLKVGVGIGAQYQSNNAPSASGNLDVYIPFLDLQARGSGELKSKSDIVFASQFKAGLAFTLFENLTIDIGYGLRFLGGSDAYAAEGTFVDGSDVYYGKLRVKIGSHWNHLISAGLSYKF